jgi:hypothetical protein
MQAGTHQLRAFGGGKNQKTARSPFAGGFPQLAQIVH